jgi:hypothetical protein
MTRFFLVVLLGLLLGACGNDDPPLVAADVVVRPPMPGMQMTAGYLTLRNNSDDEITIDRVTSPQFGRVEMHETLIEDGVSRMQALPAVVLAPGAQVEFEPGGKHLMLMRPGDDLTAVTLTFHSGAAALLTVSVSVGE